MNIMVMRSKGLFCHKHLNNLPNRKKLEAYIIKIMMPSLNNLINSDILTVSQWYNLYCLFPYVL